MLERTYTYLGYIIDQYRYGDKRYFYPQVNGNFECTDIRKVCRYIKMLIWLDKITAKYLK